MKKQKMLILFLILASCPIVPGEGFRRGFLLTGPAAVTPGADETYCVTFHHVTGSARGILDLTWSDGTRSSAEMQWNEVSGPDIDCFTLPIPLLTSGGAEEEGRLRLRVRFSTAPGYVVDGWGVVALAYTSRATLALAETDLPVYRPGDLVRMRVLLIRPTDLALVQSVIYKIWILNPSYLKVAQWNNVTTQLGLAELNFRLSSDPQQGVWRMKVLINYDQKQEDETTFEVRHHVLSKFHLNIQHNEEMTFPSDHYSWKICARYSYGKSVKGILTINLKATTESPSGTVYNETQFKTEMDGRKGCLNYTIMAQEELILGPGKISINASMIEDSTGATETAAAITKITKRAFDMRFVNTEKYFRHGMGFTGQLKISMIGTNNPKSDLPVTLCFTAFTPQGENTQQCKNYKTNRMGLLIFRIAALGEDVSSVTITVINYEGAPTLSLSPWSVQSTAHIIVSRPAGSVPLLCGIEYDFPLVYTAPEEALHAPQTMHYIIKSRGGIALRGSIPVPASTSTSSPAHDLRGVLPAVTLVLGRAATRKSTARISLRLRITSRMSPDAWLVVYYARGDGELVSGGTRFEVQKCYGQRVHQSWTQTRAQPGDAVTLRLRAFPNSLCAISTVDGRTKQSATENNDASNIRYKHGGSITSDRVYERIVDNAESRENSVTEETDQCAESNILEANKTQSDSKTTPISRKRRSTSERRPTDALGTFQNADLIVLTDLDMKTLPCIPGEDDQDNGGQSLVDTEDPGIPSTLYQYSDSGSYKSNFYRDYFPETWLWELVHIGPEGKHELTYELPHTLTSWHSSAYCMSEGRGLGVATPSIARITTFQPFFVDLATPYSIKRGELVGLVVQVFNYLEDGLPVSLSVNSTEGLSVIMPDGSSNVSKCVASNDIAIFNIQIQARDLGKFNLTLTAQIDAGYPESCGPDILVNSRDTLVKQILVEPEGFPVEITKSAFLCPNEFPKEASLTWSWELPSYVVENSIKAQVSVIGELMAPILQNLDNLVQLPLGCGEQNMILFVPNLYVLSYLDANRIENDGLRSKAMQNLKIGYERQLNYRHKDGGYSAFGENDETPSTWLTAFVLRTFAQLQRHMEIDKNDLSLSRSWLMSQQLENGCFPSTGYVFNSAMKGGLYEEDLVALTAFILISLIETRLPVKRSSISSARFCIGSVNHPGANADLYTLGLAAYAYALLGPQKKDARSSLTRLLRRATEDEGMLYWQSEDDHLAVNIEITSYAILTLIRHGGRENMARALSAVKYLSRHRNSHGGFVSTQDTNVALQALAEYANSAPLHTTNMSVSISSNNIIQDIPVLNDSPVTTVKLTAVPGQVSISARGEGCVVIQGSLTCNVRATAPSKSFSLEVRAKPLSRQQSCASIQNIRVCTWLRLRHVPINMAVLEVMMPTGYEPDRASLFRVQEARGNFIKRFEEQSNVVLFYLINLPTRRMCLDFLIVRSQHVMNIENAKPAHVRIYDYYKPDITTVKSYLLPMNCEQNSIPMFFEMEHVTDNTQSSGTLDEITTEIMDIQSHATPYYKIVNTTPNVVNTTPNYLINSTEVTDDSEVTSLIEEEENSDDLGDISEIKENNQEVEEMPESYRTSHHFVAAFNETDCPMCYVGFPVDFAEIYCKSVNAFYSDDANTILMDFNPKKREFLSMNLTLNIEIDDDCDCKPFFRAGAHLLVMDHGLPFLDILHPDSTLVLGSSSHILGLGPVSGTPAPSKVVQQRIRRARQMCRFDRDIDNTTPIDNL